MSNKKMLLRPARGGPVFWGAMSKLQPRMTQLAIGAVCLFAGLGILRVVLL